MKEQESRNKRKKTNGFHTLIVFNHTGREIPWHLKEHFASTDEAWLRESIDANHDLGTEYIYEGLQEKWGGENGEKAGVKLVYYPFSRVFADSNRTLRESQIVDEPYRSHGVWKKGVDKEMLGKELLDPFYAEFAQILQENDIKFIFYVHSMDEFGGGVASDGHEQGRGERRPESMLSKVYKFADMAAGIYGPADAAADRNLLTDDQIQKIQQIHSKHIQQIPGYENVELNQINIPTDYPYIAPRMLCGVAMQYFDGPQLVIDIRKDLFQNGSEQMLSSVIEMTESMLNEL